MEATLHDVGLWVVVLLAVITGFYIADAIRSFWKAQ